MRVKLTRRGNSYWEEKGSYQEDYEKYSHYLRRDDELKKDFHWKLLHAIEVLHYDYYNNRNANMVDVQPISTECDYCDGDGYDEVEFWNEDEEDYDTEELECNYCSGTGSVWEDEEYRLTNKAYRYLEILHEEPDLRKYVERLETLLETPMSVKFGDEDRDAYELELIYANIIDIVIFNLNNMLRQSFLH